MLGAKLSVAALSALAFACPLWAQTIKRCYGLDGVQSDPSMQPCDPKAEFSSCCALNKTQPDICMSSGLCFAQDGGYQGFMFANGCTDPTGKAEACPHVCPDRTNDRNGGPTISSYNVLQCNIGGKYCCRQAFEQENCCGNESAIVTISAGTVPTQTVGASTTATITSANCDAARLSSKEQCPKDNTAVVGGAVGGILGAALLASLGALAVMCARRPKEQHTHAHTHNNGHTEYTNLAVAGVPAQELSARPVHEMQGSQVRSEFGSSQDDHKPY